MSQSQTFHDDVLAIIDEVAAREVMPRWQNLGSGDISEKTGPEDIVTVADQAAETALTARFRRLLPGSEVIGEEAISADPSVRQHFGGSGPIWIIDPIDGTSAFAAGEPEFAIMVGLLENGVPVSGWIVAPARGLSLWGGRDAGVWRRTGENRIIGRLERPAPPSRLADMVGLLGKRNITPERRAELKARETHFKALDGVTCAGIDYQRLAGGEAHFAAYSKSEPWDHLPGLAILKGLGFHYAKHDGTPYRPGDSTGGLLVTPDADSFAAIRSALLG